MSHSYKTQTKRGRQEGGGGGDTGMKGREKKHDAKLQF